MSLPTETVQNPSIISHVSLGTNDFAKASKFYDAVLGALGFARVMDFPGAIAWGKVYPEFWLQTPIDEKPASVGNGTHIAFLATSKEQVHAFFEAAVGAGGKGEGEPGARPHYGPEYYGCFVRDLDGHKIEATWWDFAAEQG